MLLPVRPDYTQTEKFSQKQKLYSLEFYSMLLSATYTGYVSKLKNCFTTVGINP